MAARARILLHLNRDGLLAVDPADVFFIESEGNRTRVRLARRRTLLDTRSLVDVPRLLRPHGFIRVHRSCAAAHDQGRRITPPPRRQRRPPPRSPPPRLLGWEAKLEPPVNKALPVTPERADALWKAFGEKWRAAEHGGFVVTI